MPGPKDEKKRCQGKLATGPKRGQRCPNARMADSQYCFKHDPRKCKESKEASRKGGLNRKTFLPKEAQKFLFDKTKDVVKYLEDTLDKVSKGELDVKVGQCIGLLTNVMLKALQTNELEKVTERLDKLEREAEAEDSGISSNVEQEIRAARTEETSQDSPPTEQGVTGTSPEAA